MEAFDLILLRRCLESLSLCRFDCRLKPTPDVLFLSIREREIRVSFYFVGKPPMLEHRSAEGSPKYPACSCRQLKR